MQRSVKKSLYDIQQAAALVAKFTAGKTLADYSGDPLLRSAVERQFDVSWKRSRTSRSTSASVRVVVAIAIL